MEHQKKGIKGLQPDFKKKKVTGHKAGGGLVLSNSMDSNTKPKEIKYVLPFLWLLHIMSHFRDLNVVGVQHQINCVHSHEHNFFNGLNMYLMSTQSPILYYTDTISIYYLSHSLNCKVNPFFINPMGLTVFYVGVCSCSTPLWFSTISCLWKMGLMRRMHFNSWDELQQAATM
jgi:hypothetical protein